MDFAFSEEERLFRASVKGFCDKNVAPYYMERARQDHFDPKLNDQLASMGYLGMAIPQKYGGSLEDSTAVMLGILSEELGRADQVARARCSGTYVLPRIINNVGSEELKEMWLPGIAAGESEIAGCFTEPEGGTDAATVRVTAVKDGNDYIINGEKTSISHIKHATGLLVSCQTTPGARAHGVSLMLVPKDTPGIEYSILDDFGIRPQTRGIAKFNDVRVPAKYMVGEKDAGLYPVMGFFDIARTSIALGAIGCAEKALEDAAKYAAQRVMFGQKLSQMQSISFTFAEHHTRLEAAKLLGYRSYWMRDAGLSNTKESAQTKWFAVTDVALPAIHFAMRMYGHLGYTRDFDVMQRWIDTQTWEYGDGAVEAQKIVISRAYLGKENASKF